MSNKVIIVLLGSVSLFFMYLPVLMKEDSPFLLVYWPLITLFVLLIVFEGNPEWREEKQR